MYLVQLNYPETIVPKEVFYANFNSTTESGWTGTFNVISSIFQFQTENIIRKCNAQKEKVVPVLDIFKYKLCNVFFGRSMYMQQKTGSFKSSYIICLQVKLDKHSS